MSFKKAREQLLWAFDENFISAEEFLLLYDVNKSTNLDLPYDEYSPFDLENMEDNECLPSFVYDIHIDQESRVRKTG